MFTASSQFNVTLIYGPTDMRKAIDGLSHIVAYDLEMSSCLSSVAEHGIKSKFCNGRPMAFGFITND